MWRLPGAGCRLGTAGRFGRLWHDPTKSKTQQFSPRRRPSERPGNSTQTHHFHRTLDFLTAAGAESLTEILLAHTMLTETVISLDHQGSHTIDGLDFHSYSASAS